MDSVVPPQACVNAPQRYDLRAGEAFTVIGTKSGYVHPIHEDNGECVADPTAHPLLRGRIPLEAPACDPTADPRTGRRPDGTFEPNPCSTTVDQTENAPNYLAGSCTLGDPTSQMITRQAPAIRFRNRGMTLTIVDPYYQGDQMCIGDRAGTLPKVPIVFPGYALSWRLDRGLLARGARHLARVPGQGRARTDRQRLGPRRRRLPVDVDLAGRRPAARSTGSSPVIPDDQPARVGPTPNPAVFLPTGHGYGRLGL